MTNLLKLKDVAAIFQVTTKTIDNWCRGGILNYEAYPCGKRFDPDKIEAFRRSRSFGESHSQHP